MKILAFDTCWQACSVAAVACHANGEMEVLAERFEAMATGQAEVLPVMLSDVLETSGLSASSFERIAVPNGPGSFTGVRIAIATARALMLASDADLVTTSSLRVIASGVAADHDIEPASDLVIAMDARRNEAYVQVFPGGNIQLTTTKPELLAVADAAKLCQAQSVVIAGSAAEHVAEEIKKTGRSATVVSPNAVPRALNLARLAPNLVPLSEPLMPVYLRPPDAKPGTQPAIQRANTQGERK